MENEVIFSTASQSSTLSKLSSKEIASSTSKREPKLVLFRLNNAEIDKYLIRSPPEKDRNCTVTFTEEVADNNFGEEPEKDSSSQSQPKTLEEMKEEAEDCKPNLRPRIQTVLPTTEKIKSYVKNPMTRTFDCPICKKRNKHPFLAEFHYTTFHLGERYELDDADALKFIKRVPTTRSGKYHFNSLTGQYECSKCDEKFHRQSSAWEHYDRVHLRRKYKCEKCALVVAYRSSLIGHKKVCKGRKSPEEKDIAEEIQFFKDDFMEMGMKKKTKPSASYQYPARKKWKWTINPETGLYVCPICQHKAVTCSGAKLHYESVHLGQRHECGRCGSVYLHRSGLRLHRKKCNGVPPARPKKNTRRGTLSFLDPKTGKYYCVRCNKEFNSAHSAGSHFRIKHLNTKIFKCEPCNKLFSREQCLIRHQKDHCPTRKAVAVCKIENETL